MHCPVQEGSVFISSPFLHDTPFPLRLDDSVTGHFVVDAISVEEHLAESTLILHHTLLEGQRHGRLDVLQVLRSGK